MDAAAIWFDTMSVGWQAQVVLGLLSVGLAGPSSVGVIECCLCRLRGLPSAAGLKALPSADSAIDQILWQQKVRDMRYGIKSQNSPNAFSCNVVAWF